MLDVSGLFVFVAIIRFNVDQTLCPELEFGTGDHAQLRQLAEKGRQASDPRTHTK
jgi:hypothetical protein